MYALNVSCAVSGTYNSLIIPPPSPAPTLPPPWLAHTLHHHQKSSALSVAADSKHIFGRCQTADIHTFMIKTTLQGYTGSVLALEIARDREWLFSSSSEYMRGWVDDVFSIDCTE
ncbi:hypothetical protein M422DRAFT_783104 [Sphaerobolus stellatus SS14]|uniref:Uncharacterized protein n=1 Tax=Sphaerobolus stellatus (strain SS14) TaxID=990650 RepID=A0A0C9TTJ5_SPHS4|nr:hypothetical protein M422DRAFT_783104 [Sphaerobolus stellatus SS14]